eukprot:m.47990 g.47990  ORF g.47990 m.47990 type:complete len:211 (-) comp10809_c0_seq4:67-699(-)
MERRRELIEALVKDEFGAVVHKVARVLLLYPCTLYTLTAKCGLHIKDVRRAVLVLLQHKLVTVHTKRRPMYTFNDEMALLRGGLAHYSMKVKSMLGNMAEQMFRLFFMHGISRLSHIMEAMRLNDKTITSASMVEAFKALMDAHILQRTLTNPSNANSFGQIQFTIPHECLSLQLKNSPAEGEDESKNKKNDPRAAPWQYCQHSAVCISL